METSLRIISQLKKEARKLEIQMEKYARDGQRRLNALRDAIGALGGSNSKSGVVRKKRKLSAGGRKAISDAAKRRWKKAKTQARAA
jgi:hypothetical protein